MRMECPNSYIPEPTRNYWRRSSFRLLIWLKSLPDPVASSLPIEIHESLAASDNAADNPRGAALSRCYNSAIARCDPRSRWRLFRTRGYAILPTEGSERELRGHTTLRPLQRIRSC